MNRTSTALRRLGVPVLAATLAIPASMLFSGTAFAAAGTLSHTPANPVPTGSTVTETATASAAGQTVTLTITPNSSGAFFTSGSGSGTKQTTCSTGAGTTCSVTLSDSVAESISVNATDTPAADTFNTDTVTFASPNGTLSFNCPNSPAPNPAPCYGTASPAGGNPVNGEVAQSVTYTPGSGSTSPASAQTVTLTVSGSAWFDPTGPDRANVTAGTGTKPQTITCTIPAAAPRTCTYDVADSKSEAVTVTASGVTPDVTTPSASATVNFAGLQWSGCTGQQNTANPPDAATNCATQQGAGTTATYTITYQEAGAPAANRSIAFQLSTANGNVFPTTQPAGTAETLPNLAQCTTNAQGQCQVNVASSGTATATDTLQARTLNTSPYPASFANLLISNVPNATPGRFVITNSNAVRPAGQVDAVNEPGDVLDNTYTLYNCQSGTTSGTNACIGQTPLAGQTLTLSIDHGFFTPPCIHPATAAENYANCTFNTTPAAGTKVGDLKSLGQSITVTTNSSGQVTVGIAIGRDTAFDNNGNVIATVKATQGSTTLTESVGPGNSASSTVCNPPGSGPQAGCPSGEVWTTNAQPLNGGTAKIVSIPSSSTEAALSDSATNNVPDNQSRVFVVQLTDQYGNLTSGTSGAASTNLSLAKTGVGDLVHCTHWSSTDTCDTFNHNQNNPAGGATTSTDSTGANKITYAGVRGSYTDAFTSAGLSNVTQDRYLASACPAPTGAKTCGAAAQDGTQTLTATWKAPTTTFNTFAAATSTTPAVATYTQGTSTVTDTVTINWFNQTAQPVVTFSTTPGNTVPAGTVVTVSATVKDQFGNPIAGDGVQFVRSGPQTQNGTSCSATNSFSFTNASGKAGFSFTCTNPSTQVVTIVVQDASGNELARGTQTINFTSGGTTGRISLASVLKCIGFKNHPGVVRCRMHEAPRIAGLWYTLYRHVHGKNLRISSKRTNSNGVIYWTIRHLKPHSWFAAQAFHAGTRTTKPSHTAVNGTHVG